MTWLSPPQIAKELGIDGGKVLAWIHSRELIAVDVSETRGGRPRWRVSREALENFLRRRSTSPTETPTRRKKAEAQKYYA